MQLHLKLKTFVSIFHALNLYPQKHFSQQFLDSCREKCSKADEKETK